MNDRIKELETKIYKARDDYYNGQSQISDKIYDAWIDELLELDPKNLAVINIGCEPVSNWEKYTHKVEMGSLNKSQTFEEYLKWHQKYISPDDDVLLTIKLDGLSISLIYENGVLVKGATRGSGIIGELITSNVAKMGGVPLRLSKKINATIRGEILLSKANHSKYFQEYSNPRNSASGISRRYDGEGSDKLDVLVYQILTDDLDIKTQEEQFKILKELSFNAPEFFLIKTANEVLDLKNKYQTSLRNEYPFDLDGLVIHNNNLMKQQVWGSRDGRPYASIAYKFDSIAKEGNIIDIQIQVGNSGRITPVAVFSPKVNLMGAEIEKASLHNFGNIRDLGIGIGATVLVCRSNDVIPFVEEVVSLPDAIFESPEQCPECNTKLILNGEYVQCPNSSQCPAQVIGRIKNWVKEIDILELGDKLIEKLVKCGLVSNPADLYTLSVNDLSKLDRMGNKSAQNVYNSILKNKTIPLEVFIGALSIPLIGQSTIKLIINAGHDTLEKICQLGVYELEHVPGVGPVKAKSLAEGLKHNKQLISNLLNNGINIKDKIFGQLNGFKIAITGSTKSKRSDLEKFIINNGGEYKSSVSKSCTHLVCNEKSDSSKAQAALKLGIKVILEDNLINLTL